MLKMNLLFHHPLKYCFYLFKIFINYSFGYNYHKVTLKLYNGIFYNEHNALHVHHCCNSGQVNRGVSYLGRYGLCQNIIHHSVLPFRTPGDSSNYKTLLPHETPQQQ